MENAPEAVALKMAQFIKMNWGRGINSRETFLDLYSDCLRATRGNRMGKKDETILDRV